MARVCVTGGGGFIGSQVVRDLLEHGHEVRTTVRDPARAPDGLVDLGPEIVAADLENPDSFHPAFADRQFVIHTASPYVLHVGDPQRDLIDPAVNGTLAILNAAMSSPSVKRVVITSSFAAITDEPDGTFDEGMWNDRSSVDRNPYYFSKTAAERTAWGFVRSQTQFDLVVINPSVVFGPSLIPAVNTSNSLLVGLLRGQYPGILDLDYAIVDVRDVARAHRLAMETPKASGRYLCTAEVWTQRRLVDWIRGANLGLGNPPRIGLDNPLGRLVTRLAARFQPSGNRDYLLTHLGRHPRVMTEKIRTELGMTFRPAGETLIDTFLDLHRWGHL
ncbi:MAG TPA: NAD-dependent epimerase/dehydratase family protein [Acidimicrobiia bacterium]|nr:NAD-dependent epimerase/dehydratase family protein [Acidimicrobiia bacterium]